MLGALATVLGPGVAFLDGTIVNVALPVIARELDARRGSPSIPAVIRAW